MEWQIVLIHDSPSVEMSVVEREKNSLRKMSQGFVMLASVEISIVGRENNSLRKMSQGFVMSPSVEISIVGREKSVLEKCIKFRNVTKCQNVKC